MKNENRKPHKERPVIRGILIPLLVLLIWLSAAFGIYLVVMTENGMLPWEGIFPSREETAAVASSEASAEASAEASVPASEGNTAEETEVEEAPEREISQEETAKAEATEGKTEDKEEFLEGEVFPVRITLADGYRDRRVSEAEVLLIPGYDNPGGKEAYKDVTDRAGAVTMDVASGKYTMVWKAEGFCPGYENLKIGTKEGPGSDYISDSKKDYAFWKTLLPYPGGNALYLMLEWKGSANLDLCLFNAQTKEYLTPVAPVDSAGNFFAFDDREGSPGYEIIVIRDAMNGSVYTPYIRDGDSLVRGTLSAMEANGVRFTVINSEGVLFTKEADSREHAGLWTPCYLYRTNLIEEGAYIYDAAKSAWAAF